MIDQPQVQMRLTVDELEALDQVRTAIGQRTFGITPSRGELAKVAVLEWIATRKWEFQSPPPPDPEPPHHPAPVSTVVVRPRTPLGDIARPTSDQPARSRKSVLAEEFRGMRQAGMSYTQMIRQLTERGEPPLSGKPGARWSNSSIARLVKFEA